jgi:hypothetical protein
VQFLKKMLLDRQNSISSLFAMGHEVAAGADPVERKGIERQLRELMERFENLTTGATQRYEDLQQAMAVAKDFQVWNLGGMGGGVTFEKHQSLFLLNIQSL